MRTVTSMIAGALIAVVAIAAGGFIYVRSTGLRALPEPGGLETAVALRVRGMAIPSGDTARTNPLAGSDEAFWLGLEHFARYCAVCHSNDGSGRDSVFGSGLYPRPPDMRTAITQGLSDGELFYIIENGVRFTGMPAFGGGEPTPEGEEQAWQLVTFIRGLPDISQDAIWRMQALNPL